MSPNVPVEPAWLPAPGQPYLPAAYDLTEPVGRGPRAVAGPRVAWLEAADARRTLGLVEFAHVIAQLPNLERVTLTGATDPTQNDELAAIIGLLKLRTDRVLLDAPLAPAGLAPSTRTPRPAGQPALPGGRARPGWVTIGAAGAARGLTAARAAEIVRSGLDELRVRLPNPRFESAPGAARAGLSGDVRARLHELAAVRAREGATELRLVLRCPARRNSLTYLPALLRLAAEVGADEVYLARLVYALNREPVRETEAVFGSSTPHLDEILSECEALSVELGVALRAAGGRDPRNSLAAAAPPEAEPWRACRRPWAGVYVTTGGDCLPCRVSPEAMPGDRSLVMGNILRRPIAEIWNGPRYEGFRRALLSPQPHPACLACGVRWSL